MKEEQEISSTQKLLDIISKKNTDLENKKTTEVQWSRLNNIKAQKRPLIYLFIGVCTGVIATGGIFYLLRNSDLVKLEPKPTPSQEETIIQPQFPGKALPPLIPPLADLNPPPDSKSTKRTTAKKVQTASSSDSKEKKYQNTNVEKIIQDTISHWKTAWEQKNINTYKAFYSPVFHTGKFDLRTWLDNKEKNFQRPGAILISIQDLSISVKGHRAVATFVQHHKSPGSTDKGIKTLIWINENNEWKIVSEKWKPLIK